MNLFEMSKQFDYATIRVTQIQNGAASTKSRILNANDEVPVRSYNCFWLPMMIPENAGGNAPANTIICNLSASMWKIMPTTNKANGIRISFWMVLYTTSLSNWNFMPLRVKPAANTATPELALAISSKFGSRITGEDPSQR